MGHLCQMFFVCAMLVLLFAGIATGYTAFQIQKECETCDIKALGALAAYQTEYGIWNTALDGARYHCGRFAQVISCYTECLHDTVYTYSSQTKAVITNMYSIACDPSCYTTVIPYCYLSSVGSNDILKTCTGSAINPDLDRCLQRELFVNQECNSVCTEGQRFTHMNYFDTIFLCTIPYETATGCFSWVAYCNEQIFGKASENFTLYSNMTLIGSNRLACRHFADDYDTCVQKAVSGDVVFGSYPYVATYRKPCAGFTKELHDLVSYIRHVLVGPLCQNPSATFNDTCQGLASRTAVSSNAQDQNAPRHIPVVSRAALRSSFSTRFAVAAISSQFIAAVLLASAQLI